MAGVESSDGGASQVEEYRDSPDFNENNGGGDDVGLLEEPPEPVVKRFKFPVLPEVPCFLYFVALITQYPVLQFWLVDHFSKEFDWQGHNQTGYDTCENSTGIANQSSDDIENKVQSKTNQYVMYTSFIGNFTAILPTLFMGPMTDKFGRKFVFYVSFVGLFLSELLMTFIYYFDLSPNLLFITSFLIGLTGSYGLFLAAAFGMVADITAAGKRRAFRITTTEAAIAIANSGSTITSGIWVTKTGYVWPMVYCLAILIIAAIYTVFFIPETLIEHHGQPFSFRNLLQCFKIYFKDTPDKRRFKLVVCIFCFMIAIGTLLGESNVGMLYLLHQPFCWPKTNITIFGGVLQLAKWVVVIGLIAMCKRVISEPVFALLGSLSLVGGYLLKGLAEDNVLIFVSAGVLLFSDLVSPMCRTIMSKSVSHTEQGALFGGIGVLQMVVAAVAGIVMSSIYNVGLGFFLGLPYMVMSGLVCINVVLLIALAIHMKRHPYAQQPAPEERIIN